MGESGSASALPGRLSDFGVAARLLFLLFLTEGEHKEEPLPEDGSLFVPCRKTTRQGLLATCTATLSSW